MLAEELVREVGKRMGRRINYLHVVTLAHRLLGKRPGSGSVNVYSHADVEGLVAWLRMAGWVSPGDWRKFDAVDLAMRRCAPAWLLFDGDGVRLVDVDDVLGLTGVWFALPTHERCVRDAASASDV